MHIAKIEEAIYKLMAKNCRREELQISYSPLVQRIIEQECYEAHHLISHQFHEQGGIHKVTTLFGVELYSNHPYNEIVVFHKERASYNSELIERITVSNYELVNIVVKEPVDKTIEELNG